MSGWLGIYAKVVRYQVCTHTIPCAGTKCVRDITLSEKYTIPEKGKLNKMKNSKFI